MELQFQKSICRCLQQVKYEMKEQEQTQEVRLEDALPDIGRVVDVWGQVILRSKEWRSGQLSVAGGVMAWVLYMPEDESTVQCVETWLPFQLRWDVPDSSREGALLAMPFLCSIDARSISSRKLMVRCVVGITAQALAQQELELYAPSACPEGLQILKNTYPVLLPKEAGEKPFSLEEELRLPAGAPVPKKLVRFALEPTILEKKVLGGRLVFRGTVYVHLVYLTEEAQLHCCDMTVPFSQFTELDQSYEQEASAAVMCAVTGAEIELLQEGQLLLKAGLTAQYIIYDHCLIELCEDAYSTKQPVQLSTQELLLPVVLDNQEYSLRPNVSLQPHLLDRGFYPLPPRVQKTEQGAQVLLTGFFRQLYCDENGHLQSNSPTWEESIALPAEGNTQITAQVSTGLLETDVNMQLEIVCTAGRGMPMITGITVEEADGPEGERPSLILRKKGSDSLWEVAKSCCSTIDAIRTANKLTGEPADDQLLLIPVC